MRIELDFEVPCEGATVNGEWAYCDNGVITKGWTPSFKRTRTLCPTCGGRGYIPTETGQQLLNFLEHQGFIRTAPTGAGEE